LEQLATKTALREVVITNASKMLETQHWRGLEQATILLTLLDHKPAARRMVALLEFDRAEVRITAAWGLRKLDVAETLDDVVTHVDAELKRLLAGMGPPGPGSHLEVSDHQLSQLNQFLRQRKHGKADEALRKFIPHRGDRPMTECRAAAMWALGKIHEGKKVEDELATSLEARLNDTHSTPPEETAVRRMCAIALGRMKAENTTASLRKCFAEGEPTFDPVNNASGWAIEQITGEAVPPPKTVKRVMSDWFLVPGY
jgi:HEAT repeat protein